MLAAPGLTDAQAVRGKTVVLVSGSLQALPQEQVGVPYVKAHRAGARRGAPSAMKLAARRVAGGGKVVRGAD